MGYNGGVKKTAFRKKILDYYRAHRRDFPWRNTRNPYHILVSEIMLQQTQASRVVSKYTEFLVRFPTVEALAEASTRDVLGVWKGLGYNRRALALKRAAESIVRDHRGRVPKDFDALVALPGIGPATAGDILAFAWNIPTTVIETNIRTVYIHFFFPHKKNVHDRDIIPLIKETMSTDNPREWYSALMDYGAMLKQTNNASRRSAHYMRQSPFKGSNRELRSRILDTLMRKPSTTATLARTLTQTPDALTKNLTTLTREGFICKDTRGVYRVV